MTAIHHDSTHGRCPQSSEITLAPSDHPDHLPPTQNNPTPSALLFRGRLIHLFSQRDPKYVDWASAGVAFVMESTGKRTTRETASVHITHGGAKKVLISAPSKDVPNVVYGVNHQSYTGSDDILSNASCTVSQISCSIHTRIGTQADEQDKLPGT
jgi:glyceraldehyde 3-phosphate dehydrogenase